MKTSIVDLKTISSLSQVSHLAVADFAPRVEPNTVLMCEPTYFTVKETQNPFMDGKVGSVNSERAMEQWGKLKSAFELQGHPVKVVAAQKDLEDMVFAANQVLPGIDANGSPFVIMSEMRYPSRRREVPWYRTWFEDNGYRILTLADSGLIKADSEPPCFEGQGDALWHPGRRLLWGGYGHRTEAEAYKMVSALTNAPVVKLRLINPTFYHLDTCFCPIDEDTVVVYLDPFDSEGQALIRHFFKDVIEVSVREAYNFACNAAVLGKDVFLQKGSPDLEKELLKRGLNPISVDTSEFMKSGGSVFCLKMFIY